MSDRGSHQESNNNSIGQLISSQGLFLVEGTFIYM